MLSVVRKLVTGQFSLAMTYWGWGCGSALVLATAMSRAINQKSELFFWSILCLKLIVPSMVLSGILCKLNRKITILGMLAAVHFITYVLTVGMVIFGVIFAYLFHIWKI